LVGGARPDVGETAGGKEDGDFGLDIARSSHGCHVWTGSRELGLEFQGVLPVVGNTVISRPKIA
jgi:hypothetical protein